MRSGGELSDKAAVVTGAGSGLGRGIALALATAGARISVADVDPAGGRATVEAIARGGGTGRFVEADVSDATSVRRMIDGAVMPQIRRQARA
jgi:NAD(P)-dependent dehydrogenase (short-subunit alcohol dehydrogenase family)